MSRRFQRCAAWASANGRTPLRSARSAATTHSAMARSRVPRAPQSVTAVRDLVDDPVDAGRADLDDLQPRHRVRLERRGPTAGPRTSRPPAARRPRRCPCPRTARSTRARPSEPLATPSSSRRVELGDPLRRRGSSAGSLPGRARQLAKVQREAPCGSAVATPTALLMVNRHSGHGPGPADWAEYGAASAIASTSAVAGHPPSAYKAATVVTSSASWAQPRLALQRQVEPLEPQRDRARRVVHQLPHLQSQARAEEQRVVVDDDPDSRDMQQAMPTTVPRNAAGARPTEPSPSATSARAHSMSGMSYNFARLSVLIGCMVLRRRARGELIAGPLAENAERERCRQDGAPVHPTPAAPRLPPRTRPPMPPSRRDVA